eukprot:scaffold984_cov144-Skeletonema_marinoi.AAC.7
MGNRTVTGNTMTREDFLRTLFTDANLLQIWAISISTCPYGGMAHGSNAPQIPLWTTPFARSLSLPIDPKPRGRTSNPSRAQLRIAFSHATCKLIRSSSKPAHQKFYGHSYTAPTPRPEDPLPPTPTVRPRLHQSVCHPPTPIHIIQRVGGVGLD